jgi:DNA polymerase-3 subunit gamma/tau
MICGKEQVEADAEALAMIAAAAEGSVRDGLSILDQAIAHADLGGNNRVTAAAVQDMLGLADKGLQRRLYAALLAGEGKALLYLVETQFALGVEPAALLRGAMELTHRITVAQLGQDVGEAASPEEREAIAGWAKGLSAGQLHRLWQLLLKGFEEVRTAPDPLIAAQMALLRVMHASDMPDPGSLVKKLEELASRPAPSGGDAGSGSANPAASAPSAPDAAPPWEALVDRVDRAGKLQAAQIMRDWVRVVSLKPGELTYALVPGYAGDPAPDLRDGLLAATGERWQVVQSTEQGAPALRELAEQRAAEQAAALKRHPLVEAAFAAFPDAEFIDENDVAPMQRGERKWSRNR